MLSGSSKFSGKPVITYAMMTVVLNFFKFENRPILDKAMDKFRSHVVKLEYFVDLGAMI